MCDNIMCPECIKNNPKDWCDPFDILHRVISPYRLCSKCKNRLSDYRFFNTHELEQLEMEGGVYDNKRNLTYKSLKRLL